MWSWPRAAHCREFVDEFVSKGLFASLPDKMALPVPGLMLPFCAHESVGHVGVDGVVEEEGLLLDETNLRAPPLDIDIVELVASGGDASTKLDWRAGFLGFSHAVVVILFLGGFFVFLPLLLVFFWFDGFGNSMLILEIIPPLNQADYGAFAGARRADNGRDLARLDPEVQVIQNLDVRPAGVSKGHVLQNDVARSRYFRRPEVPLIGLGRIDNCEELAGGYGGFADGQQWGRDALEREDYHHDGEQNTVFQ